MDDTADTITALVAEQARLSLPGFGPAEAWTLGGLLTDLAIGQDAPVTVDIRTAHQILFHCARPGTTPDNDRWVERKSRTVFHYLESSWLVRQRFLARDQTFEQDSGLDPLLYAAHGGSFPLIVRGAGLVAAVTVSGLPQRDDHELVVRGLTAYLAN